MLCFSWVSPRHQINNFKKTPVAQSEITKFSNKRRMLSWRNLFFSMEVLMWLYSSFVDKNKNYAKSKELHNNIP